MLLIAQINAGNWCEFLAIQDKLMADVVYEILLRELYVTKSDPLKADLIEKTFKSFFRLLDLRAPYKAIIERLSAPTSPDWHKECGLRVMKLWSEVYN